MPELFESTSIKSLSLINRFVRSATWEGLADEKGAPTSRLVNLMAKLARGGVGLIISSHCVVSRDGRSFRWKLGLYDPSVLPGLRRMAEAVHKEGGVIALQIAHGGIRADSELAGTQPIGPSFHDLGGGKQAREMSLADIQRIKCDFIRAASMAKEAGFDAVQIHAAHGYLLSQFLSPYYNQRCDRYGGVPANRARLTVEVLEGVREQVGDNYPLLIKMNSQDYLKPGLTVQDMLEVASLLEKAGADAIELSGGTSDSGVFNHARKGRIAGPDQEVYYRDAARLLKDKINIPLMLVGGIRSLETSASLVRDGLADYVCMSRPFIREPDLIMRWQSGDTRSSACLSDNLCYGPIRSGKGICCVALEKSSPQAKLVSYY